MKKDDGILNSYKQDFISVVCSSKKRIFKILGCLFIPFIYAFICIAAFWNPLAKIGTAPIAVVSLDKPADGSESYVDGFMDDWKNDDFKNVGMYYDSGTNKYCAKATEKFDFTNIIYLNGDQASSMAQYDVNTKKWTLQDTSYYMVIALPTNFTDNIKSPSTFVNAEGTIDKYISYQLNFVSCEILDMGSQFIVAAMLQNLISDLPIPNINSLINSDVPNQQFAIYGVGIGELFLCVGMWVGGFAMVLVYDRKKRVRNLSPPKWYFSKKLFMFTLSIVQSLIVMIAVGCLGFFGLGVGFIYEWMLIAFGGLIFISIIQSLWFCFRDRSVANICMIIFLVLNIACGFGTFPAFMQFPIFHYLSYIMPFTYLNHAQGAILYGISSGTNVFANSVYVLQMCGILLIYPVIFGTLGILMSFRRQREIFYGSWKKKEVLSSLRKLKIDDKYVNEKGKLVWNKLPKEQMFDVIKQTMQNHPYEKKFKWFSDKEHFVQQDLTVFE